MTQSPTRDPRLRGLETLPLSAVYGALAGSLAVAVWSAFSSVTGTDTVEFEMALYGLWGILLVSVFALPFVSIGLLVFGLPVATALHRDIGSSWIGLLSVLWGAIAGKLTYTAGAIAWPELLGRLSAGPGPDIGLCYGLATATVYWWMQRRPIIRTESCPNH